MLVQQQQHSHSFFGPPMSRRSLLETFHYKQGHRRRKLQREASQWPIDEGFLAEKNTNVCHDHSMPSHKRIKLDHTPVNLENIDPNNNNDGDDHHHHHHHKSDEVLDQCSETDQQSLSKSPILMTSSFPTTQTTPQRQKCDNAAATAFETMALDELTSSFLPPVFNSSTPIRSRCLADRFIPVREPDHWGSTFCQTKPTLTGVTEKLLYNEVFSSKLPSGSRRLQQRRSLFNYNKPTSVNDGNTTLTLWNESTSTILNDSVTGKNQKRLRQISEDPYRCLDTPLIEHNIKMHLVDWSARDIIAVALGVEVYLTSHKLPMVHQLEWPSTDVFTSKIMVLKWNKSGSMLAVGTQDGRIHLWSVEGKVQNVPTFKLTIKPRKTNSNVPNQGGVNTIAWNHSDYVFCAGNSKGLISYYDLRGDKPEKAVSVLRHSCHSEITSLEWCPKGRYLAAGTVNGKVHLWEPSNMATRQPLYTIEGHRSIVKAIAWSPHKPGVLATGSGTCIKFWNTANLSYAVSDNNSRCKLIKSVKMEENAFVTSLIWSRNTPDELVSTHISDSSTIFLWKYPTMERVCQLRKERMVPLPNFNSQMLPGINCSVLSADGRDICVVNSDESIQFWSLFPEAPKQQRRGDAERSQLDLFAHIR